MKRILLYALACLILLLGPLACTPTVPAKPGGLAVGDEAYPFKLSDSAGRTMRLGDVKNDWYLMLVFYRGHWCTACLNQLLDFKRDYDRFTAQKTALAFISTDPPETSAEFNASWRFPFPLLSDPAFDMIDAYGARHPKGNEGKDISKPLIVIVGPDKRVVFKYLGHSPVDRPSNSELLDWIKKHGQSGAKP